MNPLNRMNPGAPAHIAAILAEHGGLVTGDGQPYTGNGYGAEVSHVSGEPTSIPEYVESIVIRAGDLNRWIGRVAKFKVDGPIVREIIARMEGDLQQLRTLVKDIEQAER